jgi:hypothetical protein
MRFSYTMTIAVVAKLTICFLAETHANPANQRSGMKMPHTQFPNANAKTAVAQSALMCYGLAGTFLAAPNVK